MTAGFGSANNAADSRASRGQGGAPSPARAAVPAATSRAKERVAT